MLETAMTRQGRVSGMPTNHATAFLGIPYATPPVGPLRWRPPHDPVAWQGTFAADRYSPVAMQFAPVPNSLYYPGSPPQSEDCLTLNIWTPAQDRAAKLPVIVWFHLGAFMFGSSACVTHPEGRHLFDGDALASKGVIVVTVNYRLGRMGFLAHPLLTAESDHGASGNYGLMDQVAALRWVRDNIAEFGGNPENVTIAGVSAGSASSSIHMASPLSKGLFHRVIAGSGAFMGPPSKSSGLFDRLLDLPSAEARGEQLTKALGIKTLKALRALDAQELLAAPVPVETGPWYMDALGSYIGEGIADTNYPIVDGYVLFASPGRIFRSGQFNQVPVLTGSPMDDCAGLPGIPNLADYIAYLKEDMGEIADTALQAYPATDDQSAKRASGDLLADRIFGWQNWARARLAAQYGDQPVYYYDWHHPAPIPEGRYAETQLGAVHAVEMFYGFGNLDAYDWPWTAEDRKLSDCISGYWTNFAKTGDPNGEGLPEWQPLDPAAGIAMQIHETPAMGPMQRRQRFAVMDAYYADASQS